MSDTEGVRVLRIYLDDKARIALQTGWNDNEHTTYAWQVPREQWTHIAVTVRLIIISHIFSVIAS